MVGAVVVAAGLDAGGGAAGVVTVCRTVTPCAVTVCTTVGGACALGSLPPRVASTAISAPAPTRSRRPSTGKSHDGAPGRAAGTGATRVAAVGGTGSIHPVSAASSWSARRSSPANSAAFG